MICAADAVNVSGAPLSDVRIVHEPTGRFFAVGTLLPGRSFFLDFRERELVAQSAVVSWTDASGRPHEDRLDMRGVGQPGSGRPLRITYVIGEDGEADGFGLGLTIARRAVDLHGGTIMATNRQDGGLCVEISLPAAP